MQVSSSATNCANKNLLQYSKNIKYEAITEENETPLISPPNLSMKQVDVGQIKFPIVEDSKDNFNNYDTHGNQNIVIDQQYGLMDTQTSPSQRKNRISFNQNKRKDSNKTQKKELVDLRTMRALRD